MRIAIVVTLLVTSSILSAAAADPGSASAAQSQREFSAAYAVLARVKANVAEA